MPLPPNGLSTTSSFSLIIWGFCLTHHVKIMCKLTDWLKPPAALVEYEMTRDDLLSLIRIPYPKALVFLDDKRYYYVSHVDWGKVIRDVLLNMPAYLTDKFDCENVSNVCRCRTSSIYKLNTMGEAVGPSPWGYHAFNLFVSDIDGEPKLFILEPQTSDIYTVEEDSGYFVDRLVIG